jgi:hypothetical protein
MAMEIQIMRRAGYAMKIKTPAEAAEHPSDTNRKVAPVSGLCGGWISQAAGPPRAKKSFFLSRLRASSG